MQHLSQSPVRIPIISLSFFYVGSKNQLNRAVCNNPQRSKEAIIPTCADGKQAEFRSINQMKLAARNLQGPERWMHMQKDSKLLEVVSSFFFLFSILSLACDSSSSVHVHGP
ncbi:hypothetical protein BDV38DRAFT_256834 [Aspergillus pseudotamarii]|uniref:Uncharacterized protein n=1 Tax=Aspergillus pseudotamarii TaxID=132259 RepID=A0A5N6SKP8_ASPPS|nr:uncharacterized protein BDV38DRAFT_256834 [Aspergillus pseudotamarii]KAE8133963.1 hypothetical protein BDV38DRAFT_256834 [Aspergillus pseudotamarii]